MSGWERSRKPRTDLLFVFDRYLLSDDTVDQFVSELRRLAPRWAEGLVLRPSSKEKVEIASDVESVAGYVQMAVTMRGPAYGRAVDELRAAGQRVIERVRGDTELHGRNSALISVISVDAAPPQQDEDRVIPGNQIALQLEGARFEGRGVADWALEAMETLCDRLHPAWAACYDFAEWDRKVMSHVGGLSAVGVDFGRYLPGVFAWNFFGRPYCEQIGTERLLTTPGSKSRAIDDGVLVQVVDDPHRWDDPAAGPIFERALQHIGPEHFFSMAQSGRSTKAPDWRRFHPLRRKTSPSVAAPDQQSPRSPA